MSPSMEYLCILASKHTAVFLQTGEWVSSGDVVLFYSVPMECHIKIKITDYCILFTTITMIYHL